MNKGKSLFDSDDFDELENYENNNIYEENQDKSSLNTDKIFGNAFNAGETEFEVFGKLQLQNETDSFNATFTDNSYETYERKELQKDLYDIFIDSPFYEKFSKIKQVPKNEMAKIYYYFAEPVRRKKRYTMIEIFTEISNFMNLNYKEMFHNLLPLDKQLIIEELDDTYGILKKRKIKRLF